MTEPFSMLQRFVAEVRVQGFRISFAGLSDIGRMLEGQAALASESGAERDGAERREAVNQALRLRVRPIFMTTLTSIFGMLPLVLMPGAGSVIYRGLATVIVGGMSVSTLFTLLLLPSLLRLGEKASVRHIPRYLDEESPVDLRRAS